MSTWWYLECLDHDPPLRSGDEVEQHTSGLPAIHDVIARRHELVERDTWETGISRPAADYFQANAARFLVQHPKCSLQLVSEYGDIRPVESGDTNG